VERRAKDADLAVAVAVAALKAGGADDGPLEPVHTVTIRTH